MERAFCVCRSITCTLPVYFRFIPFGPGPVTRVIALASPWLGSIERPPIDRWVRRSLVSSDRLPAKLFIAEDCSVELIKLFVARVAPCSWPLGKVRNCLLLAMGAAPWSCQTARETPLYLGLKSNDRSNACLCTSYCQPATAIYLATLWPGLYFDSVLCARACTTPMQCGSIDSRFIEQC